MKKMAQHLIVHYLRSQQLLKPPNGVAKASALLVPATLALESLLENLYMGYKRGDIKSELVLGSLALAVLEKIILDYGLPAFKRPQEKEADLFACDQLIKIRREDLVVRQIASDLLSNNRSHVELQGPWAEALAAKTHPTPPEEARYLIQCLKEKGFKGALTPKYKHVLTRSLALAKHNTIDEISNDILAKQPSIAKVYSISESLIIAAHDGDEEAVKEALTQDADVNHADKSGYTALLWATIMNHIPIVKLLLEYKAHVNQPDKFGITPLMKAARYGHTSIAQLLIEHKADVNQTDFENGHKDIVRLLLGYGADVNEANNEGETALTLATKSGHSDIVELLQAALTLTSLKSR